jgi:hypothetical protein
MDSSGLDPRTADARSGGPGVSALRLLRSPVPLDCYELRGVIAEGSTAIVYLGTDQYMPWGLTWRDAKSRVVPLSPAQERAANLSWSHAELPDAYADLARLKAAVELAKNDLAAARRKLLQAHAALAYARRLTRLCSWPGLMAVGRRRAPAGAESAALVSGRRKDFIRKGGAAGEPRGQNPPQRMCTRPAFGGRCRAVRWGAARSMKAARPAAPQTPGKRFLFLRFDFAGLDEPVQAANMSSVAFVTAVRVWRFASTAIRARAELATELAPLNHMLMNGFFFNQGLDM